MTTQPVPRREEDQRVTLRRLSWDRFERFLDLRGDAAGARVTYLEGDLELMSPSRRHEWIKTVMGRLLEAYAIECDIPLEGFGSWTVRRAIGKAALEPDECYVLGPATPDRPDLALEVVWTSGGIDKLEVYARLGVPEVWFWEEGRITVCLLREHGYEPSPRSALLPDLDLERFASFIDRPSQTQAVRDLLAWLREGT